MSCSDTRAIAIAEHYWETIRGQHCARLARGTCERSISRRRNIVRNGFNDRSAVNLIQPQRITRQAERRAQSRPILGHRARVIADVRAEIQARVRAAADTARTRRRNGAHVCRRGPVSLDELQSSHFFL
jgi:hypothetical protein